MPDKHSFSLNRCYGVFFLILTVALAVVFLLQATDIYFGALEAREVARDRVQIQAQPEGWSDVLTRFKIAVAVNEIPIYSRQIVGRRLLALLPYILVWVAALIGAIVIALVRPSAPAAAKRDPDIMLDGKLRARRARMSPIAKDGQEDALRAATQQALDLRRQARIFTAVYAVLCVACLVLPLLYLCNAANFPGADITREVRAAALYVLPFLPVLLIGGITYIGVMHLLMKRESDAVKAAVAAAQPVHKDSSHTPARIRKVARITLLAVGLALFVLGIFNGSMSDVLAKAINICTECIGLG